MADAVARVGHAEREAFLRDGVVPIRRCFARHWLDTLGRGIERNLETPSPWFEARTMGGSAARYCEDFWAWSRIPEFEAFVRDSPAAAIAGALLAARRINLVMDNWFLREAGAESRAPWHHDIAYFDFEGSMCVLWLPLEPTGRDEGIAFVRGSHRWGRLFQRVYFRDHRAAGAPGWVKGRYYEAPPDVEAEPDRYDVVAFDLEPGDCLVFDMRTLHGAFPGPPPGRTIRRYSLRMTAEDGRIRYRGDWAKKERAIFEQAGHRDGDVLDSAFFPKLWTAE